jgi:hypothetical protein
MQKALPVKQLAKQSAKQPTKKQLKQKAKKKQEPRTEGPAVHSSQQQTGQGENSQVSTLPTV